MPTCEVPDTIGISLICLVACFVLIMAQMVINLLYDWHKRPPPRDPPDYPFLPPF